MRLSLYGCLPRALRPCLHISGGMQSASAVWHSRTGSQQQSVSWLPGSTGLESAQSQVSLRFIFGWMTEAMLANMLKYGNNNLILLGATFGTNHMKMPLYTGLVMDAFGNGLPAFMVLCQGVSEEDITTLVDSSTEEAVQRAP
ncbi:hypothetical protein ABBQ32_000315 [Trebouxia sp. C0010 RCD-2024]